MSWWREPGPLWQWPAPQRAPRQRLLQGIKTTLQTPFLNLDPFQWWYWVENVSRVRINGESCMALLDIGAQINIITLKYVKWSLIASGANYCPHRCQSCLHGVGQHAYTRPLGYVVIQVQVDRVQGYDEDQIALVISDFSNFAAQFTVILGTPTISQGINVMKEAEVDALAMPWVNARVVHLLSVHRMMTMEVGDGPKEEPDPDGYDQLMYTQNVETIEPFSSCISYQWRQEGPILENISMSWYKPCELKMALCHRASQYRTHTPSWGKAVKRQLWW